MSVMRGYTIVMRMPTVLMWWEDLTVLAILDSLEMVFHVRVMVSFTVILLATMHCILIDGGSIVKLSR